VLLVSASDTLKVQVKDMLFTCDVAVASTSAQAVFYIESKPLKEVIFDPSMANMDIEAIFSAAKAAKQLEPGYIILDWPDMRAIEILKRFQNRLRVAHLEGELRLVGPERLRTEVFYRKG
jgi:hypothetical protein